MSLLLRPITLVWLLLVLATGASWRFGTEHVLELAAAHPSATATIIVIALIKIRLVMRHFMEVRSAPLPLKLMCDAWLVLVGSVVLGLYWHGLHHVAG
jgi:hypothetical protein